MAARRTSADEALTPALILAAFEKLFGEEGRSVRRFQRSGLCYVELPGDARLIEQNPEKPSRARAWLDRGGCRAWVMRDGEYLTRVIDGTVEIFDRKVKGESDE
jgi:hypothetical protein